MRYFLFVLFLFVLLSAPAYALTEETVYHEGRERIFLVHVPENLKDKRGIPTVIAMHGGGGSAEQFASHIKMEETADKEGFIVVYPQGTSKKGRFHTWNSGKCCASAQEENVDDVGYISKVIDFVAAKYGVDRTRIYATGHSNGSMMSYRLACELSDKIAAIAPNGGQDMKRESCALARPVPVLHIHGKEDKCASYGGSTECGGCFQDAFRALGLPVAKKNIGTCYPVKEMVKQWAEFDGCSADASVSFQKGDVTCESYNNCKGGAEVTLCSIENAGHTWPGAEGSTKACQRRPDGKFCQVWKDQVGETNHDINANEFMWQFFKKHKIN